MWYDVTGEKLKREFLAYREVTPISILTGKFSRQPKGFGFVKIASKSEGGTAVTSLIGR